MHAYIQVIVFIVLYFSFGFASALIITLFHFIPSLDYITKKACPELHKKLFHNIFIAVIACILVFYFTNFLIGLLASLNLILHIIMDLRGRGIALLFPFSSRRFKVF